MAFPAQVGQHYSDYGSIGAFVHQVYDCVSQMRCSQALQLAVLFGTIDLAANLGLISSQIYDCGRNEG